MIRWTSLVAALLLGLAVVSTAGAQQFPPNRFFGSLTVGGQPAPAGTTVQAFIGETECATATTTAAGQYVIDVPGVTINPNCGRTGQSTVVFRVNGQEAGSAPYRDGGFVQLNLTAGAPSGGFNAAQINMDAPCVPPQGQRQCDANQQALWNADRDAWAARGVTEPAGTPPFTGPVFDATVLLRVERRDPAVIRNIAQILGNPFLQITFIRFSGGDEYVEITNLGGGPQDMSGWSLRSPDMGLRVDLPAGLTLQGGQGCRVYSNMPDGASSCGPVSFNTANAWPDTGGRIVLFFDALDLPGD
ncbi:MAG: lamin tail domain-containing protein, partial [Dehalococcoidia bacterium]